MRRAGAKPEKADKAAEELAGYENRLGGIEARLTGIDARLTIISWALGIQASMTLVILGSTFALWSRIGEISGQLAQITRAVSH
jgi:hypothetical protein